MDAQDRRRCPLPVLPPMARPNGRPAAPVPEPPIPRGWCGVTCRADAVGDTLAGSTRLAEDCLQLGLAALEAQFEQRHGLVRDGDGHVVRLVVYALGKLGGGELNFSSDVDLVYAYAAGGESDGARPLAAEDYFARLGQALARLLDAPTADGFCTLDLRLRRSALPGASRDLRAMSVIQREASTGALRRRRRGRAGDIPPRGFLARAAVRLPPLSRLLRA